MLNPESNTMREFSLTTTTSNGDSLKILFGYDTSANHSGCYLRASFNGEKPRSDAKAIKRVRALGIDSINTLIDSIGYDVTGAPYNMLEKTVSNIRNRQELIRLYRISASDSTNLTLLSKMMSDSIAATSDKQRNQIIIRFANTQRLRMLELNRQMIQDIRELYMDGVDFTDGSHSVVSFEGLLRIKHNPLYYKRDMDYIRKARVRLFKNVLKRSYRPF